MSRFPKMLWFLGGAVSACFALAVLQNSMVHSQSAPPPGPAAQPASASVANDGKLRIIAFGAHPDDCELKVAGTAVKWAAPGHHVKFLSLTNADIGRELFIGEATVKTHLLRVFAKLGVDDRTRAVMVAVERGLLARPGS